MEMVTIGLELLRPHPMNSNEMGKDRLAKLARNIKVSGRYPPLIVRPLEGEYQILDGHHRVQALRQLKHAGARCVVWDVSDEQALLLLATLNRLEGVDQPRKRAALLAELERLAGGMEGLLARLPEGRKQWESLMKFSGPPPAPTAPRAMEELPQAVHFFLLPAQRRELDAALRAVGGDRESALMELVRHAGAGGLERGAYGSGGDPVRIGEGERSRDGEETVGPSVQADHRRHPERPA